MSNHKKSTATTSTLARVNQTAILEELRKSGALSRQQLGVATGLSPATINRLTATLIEQGIVVPAGQEPSTGGRPSVLLRYAGGTRLVAALQLHPNKASGILVDFDGTVVFRREVDFGPRLFPLGSLDAAEGDRNQQGRLDKMVELFDSLILTAETMGTPCLAVGVAVPGVVRYPEGSLERIPELGWTEVPLGRLLRERTALPVVVDNDANALAFGELHRGAGRGLTSLVALLFLESGLGAGIITNGELHRGARAGAGEIGYLLMERSSLERSYSEYGDLEDRLGPIALTKRARERGIAIPEKGVLNAGDIFELAGGGDAAARELSEEILDMVAIAIAAMVIILDPELVVVGGSMVGRANSVIPAIQQRLTGRIMHVPRVEAATHRDDAVLLGAAELAAAEVNGFAYIAGR